MNEDPKEKYYTDLDRLAWQLYLVSRRQPTDFPTVSREEFLRIAGEFYDVMMEKEKPGA